VPGLCGIVQSVNTRVSPHPDRGLGTMLEHLRRFEWHTASGVELAGASMGHVAVAPSGDTVESGLAAAGDLTIAFDGELYGTPHGRSSAAGPIVDALIARGPSYFDQVHGCFTCAVWDAASRRLSIATDRFGMRPVYWARADERFLFASEPGALLKAGVSAATDESGLAQLLSFGHLLGETTLHAAIRLVPAGSWLTYDAAADTVTVQSYVASTEEPTAGSDAEWLELIDGRAVAAVRRACAGGGALGLSLSGGLDARTILGLAPAGATMTCVSLGIPGSIDHRAARALADRAGQRHYELMLAGDFLERFAERLREMAHLTDAQYLDQGIVLSTLPAYREYGIQTLLRGHAGELMHMSKAYAFSLDEQVLGLKTKSELLDWLWQHLTAYMIGGVEPAQFTGPFASRLRDLARSALERQVAALDHIEPVFRRVWHLFVAERLRRETALSLQMFRNYVEVRVPFLDPPLVHALLAAPARLKIRDDIQTFILRRHRPAFLEVVNANTGAPLGAGRLRAAVGHAKLRVYSKLRVPGYQPYERLGLWLARDLQPFLRRTLLDETFLDRGIFGRAAVESLVDQHARGERNHTFLLMALLVLANAPSEAPHA
jgi:asparagine synthase (glutamine-hydrolysing)